MCCFVPTGSYFSGSIDTQLSYCLNPVVSPYYKMCQLALHHISVTCQFGWEASHQVSIYACRFQASYRPQMCAAGGNIAYQQSATQSTTVGAAVASLAVDSAAATPGATSSSCTLTDDGTSNTPAWCSACRPPAWLHAAASAAPFLPKSTYISCGVASAAMNSRMVVCRQHCCSARFYWWHLPPSCSRGSHLQAALSWRQVALVKISRLCNRSRSNCMGQGAECCSEWRAAAQLGSTEDFSGTSIDQACSFVYWHPASTSPPAASPAGL